MHIKQTIEFFLLFLQYTVDFRLGSGEKKHPKKNLKFSVQGKFVAQLF